MRGVNTNNAPTVADLLDRYQRECIPTLGRRTQKDYVRHVGHLKRHFGHFNPDEMRPRDFGPFLDVKTGKVQRVRQLGVLAACFTQAVSVWYVMERNVLRDVKRPKFKPRDRLITDEEFAACKALAPIRVRLAMELALITGQRQGDIIAFKWSDLKEVVTEKETYWELHVYQSKTSKRMAIRVTPDLEKVIDQCWELPRRSDYILTKRWGGPYTSEGFRASWQRTHLKWLKMGGEPLHFHDIRALCATKCATLELAQALLGHSTPAMTRRVYRRGIERVQPLQLTGMRHEHARPESSGGSSVVLA